MLAVTERVERAFMVTLEALAINLHPLFLTIVCCTARQLIVIGGWRAGKSTVAAAFVFVRAQLPGCRLIWILGPDYAQARQEFRYIMVWAQKLGMLDPNSLSMPQDGSMTLSLRNGCKIETKSAQHPERLGSVAPDGILMAEPGQVNGETYIMVVGRLAERRGWMIAAGTLEDDEGHPRWAWYEELAQEWLLNEDGSEYRAFCLPSWTNTAIFPGGEEDEEIVRLKGIFTTFVFNRRIAAIPTGPENPCFPELWEPDAAHWYLKPLKPLLGTIQWRDGAHGADQGSTEDHPCVHVTTMRATSGDIWVVDAKWKVGASDEDWKEWKRDAGKEWGISAGRTDPNEMVLAQMLGYEKALGGNAGGGPTTMRLGIAAPRIRQRRFFFAIDMPGVREVFRSMKGMGYRKNPQGKLEYNRKAGVFSNLEQRYTKDVGDDGGQAVLYSLEQLIGYQVDRDAPRVIPLSKPRPRALIAAKPAVRSGRA